MADEQPLIGSSGGEGPNPAAGGRGIRSRVQSALDISIPSLKGMTASITDLTKSMTALHSVMASFSTDGTIKKFSDGFDKMAKSSKAFNKSISATTTALTGFNKAAAEFGGGGPTFFQSHTKQEAADSVKVKNAPAPATPTGSSGAATASSPAPAPNTVSVPALKNTGPNAIDVAAGSNMGQNAAAASRSGGSGLLASFANRAKDIWSAVAGSSLEYTYNRINGPSGNMNAMLQLAQALGPNVTMLNAAGRDIDIPGLIKLLSRNSPIMGTQQDVTQTILAGQSVGALLRNTPSRNGFFESARQMQVLNPGQAPGTIAGTLAGYIGNVQSQKMGAFLGEGAFTMIGRGGRYKSLAEWAEGITKFMEQHRPGGAQGTGFTPEELISQNFPGSNINAWFQMMGVPQNMVDYWWQYVLTKKGDTPASQMTSELLQKQVQKTRGINIGYEQLRTSTQGTRRDFLFGRTMYPLYGVQMAANRRFNVAMGEADDALGQVLRKSRVGQAISMLPTPILDMLMPILSRFATSPMGALTTAVGQVFKQFDMGDPMPYGDAVGGYGDAGGTTTAHLSPDLAKRVNAMMSANPNLRISSGYRDTVTQNRLRRNGNSMVAPATRSAHTRGWAVDIGPKSQMGWLMQNAGKFGLQTAAGYGEPWHIQMAGSPMGDPSFGVSIGNFSVNNDTVGAAVDIVKGVFGWLGSAASDVVDTLKDKLKSFFKNIFKSTISDTIDTAIGLYSKLLTSPTSALASIFGKASDHSNDYFAREMNRAGSTDVVVPFASVQGWSFESSGSTTRPPVTEVADPNPYGDPGYLAASSTTSSAYRGGPTIVFQAPITIHGGAGGIDARRVATTLIDRLEEEANRRSWLVT